MSRPPAVGNHGQVDMQLPGPLPGQNQAQSVEQADDWAQFINLEPQADEHVQQPQADMDKPQSQQVVHCCLMAAVRCAAADAGPGH